MRITLRNVRVRYTKNLIKRLIYSENIANNGKYIKSSAGTGSDHGRRLISSQKFGEFGHVSLSTSGRIALIGSNHVHIVTSSRTYLTLLYCSYVYILHSEIKIKVDTCSASSMKKVFFIAFLGSRSRVAAEA